MDRRNIGIFAHVDTGKTTLSESLLATSGAIQKAGSVDSGTAHTDTLPVERRRGISVKAASVSFTWNGVAVNLIDTPGHTDFSSEIERSVWALDGAILLLDGADGIQPQTEVLFKALRAQHLPLILFINKLDRLGTDAARVFGQIRGSLSPAAVLMDDGDGVQEFVCGSDDALLEDYLEGRPISRSRLVEVLRRLVWAGECFPVYCGSALQGTGVRELMDGIVEYLPPPRSNGESLSGVVFSSVRDKVMGRGLMVRLYGGRLENRMTLDIITGRDFLTGEARVEQRKITQIRDVWGHDCGELTAGDVGVVYGLGNLEIGHVFGSRDALPRRIEPGCLRTPLVNVQVIPERPEDMRALREACMALSEEDPMLQAKYVRTLDQLHLNAMGTVQLEILEETIRTRFGLKVTFSEPAIIYRETIREAAHGFVDYTMPKPCWAILDFLLEPLPPGSGVVFESRVPVKDILARYQHQVEQAIPLALRQGRLGWEVTDVKITLVGGEHHLVHTHPLDFIVATPMAIQDGLLRGGSVLLEPILEAVFLVPSDCIGKVISDVNTMRGEVLDTQSEGARSLVRSLVPVSTSLDYATTLAMATGGRGVMNVRLHGYRECPLEQGATAPRRTVDPLDKAKYILTARNAVEGALFDEA